MKTFNSRGIHLKLRPQIQNYGLEAFEAVATKIDALPEGDIEWQKIPLLQSCTEYVNFLAHLTGTDSRFVCEVLGDFLADREFRSSMSENLIKLNRIPGPGDLRFHAISLYVIARLVAPEVFIETGVASGKSSAFILLALQHNQKGKLISIDLPPTGHGSDGSFTTTGGMTSGWIVPDYLKKRWHLHLGNSQDILPKVLESNQPDIFLHDSLHTEPHAAFEFSAVMQKKSGSILMLCDNINMGCGDAFAELLDSNQTAGVAFRDFAGARLQSY